jgi:hypothetical protein
LTRWRRNEDTGGLPGVELRLSNIPFYERNATVKRAALLLTGILVAGISMRLAAQGMAASPPPSQPSAGKITAAAVWQPPQDFLSKAYAVCDKSMSAVSFPECFMNQIAAAGAPADAVAFTRMLYAQSDGQVGIMSAFKTFGKVDAAQVFYPLRANDNYGVLLVNGDPKILDVDDLKKLDQATMQQNPMFQAVKRKFPQTDLWPGDRSGSEPWPRTLALPDGGIEFIVTYQLLNGCHACQRTGLARYGWDFDASGKFLHTTFIPTPPPPRILPKPRSGQTPPPATPAPQQ